MGSTASSAPLQNRVYTKQHSFFDDLVTMLFQVTANISTFSNFNALEHMPDVTKRYLQSYGRQDRPFSYDLSQYDHIIARLHHIAAGIINPDEPFTFSSRHRPYNAYFYPYQVIAPVCSNGWPTSVEIFFGQKPVTDIMPDEHLKQVLSSSEHQYPMKAAIRSSFISYFEGYRGDVENKFGKQTTKWPTVWDFARIVRNACGHGSAIKIDNKNSNRVVWQNYQFGFADNGKSILYGPDGLSKVDIILLFEDMHAAL